MKRICKKTRAQLLPLSRQALPSQEKPRLVQHLADCPACQQERERLEEWNAAFREQAQEARAADPPFQVRAQVWERLAEPPAPPQRHRRRVWAFSLSGLSLGALLVGLLYFLGAPTPSDAVMFLRQEISAAITLHVVGYEEYPGGRRESVECWLQEPGFYRQKTSEVTIVHNEQGMWVTHPGSPTTFYAPGEIPLQPHRWTFDSLLEEVQWLSEKLQLKGPPLPTQGPDQPAFRGWDMNSVDPTLPRLSLRLEAYSPRIVRFKRKPGRAFPQEPVLVLTQFEYAADLPDGVFVMEPPNPAGAE